MMLAATCEYLVCLTYSEDMAHEGNTDSITFAWMATLLAFYLVNHVCTVYSAVTEKLTMCALVAY